MRTKLFSSTFSMQCIKMSCWFYPASFEHRPILGPRVRPGFHDPKLKKTLPLIIFYYKNEAKKLPGSYHVILSANAAVGGTVNALYYYLKQTGILTASDRRRAVSLAVLTASSISINSDTKTIFIANTISSLRR